MGKYRSKPTGGYASKRECDMAVKLHALARSGIITGLDEQVEYELIPKQQGERACKYVADFVYTDEKGEKIVMDTKGYKTREYIIKRKLMLYRWGIRITEA